MKATTYEWRKQTLAGFKANVDRLIAQRDQLNAEIDQQLGIIKALEAVQLKRPYNKTADQPGPTKSKSKKPHWTQTAAGRKKMAEVQRKAWATRKKEKA